MVSPVFENQKLISQNIKDAVFLEIPKFMASADREEITASALRIAGAFHRSGFEVLSQDAFSKAEKKLIDSFMKNIRLLVQKTWVEKSDEEYKEETLYRIDLLCKKLLEADSLTVYTASFAEFFTVLNNIVFLLFGELVKTDSFLEYAFRIDPDFGLFWHYSGCISKTENLTEEKARLAVLLAMFFLADF